MDRVAGDCPTQFHPAEPPRARPAGGGERRGIGMGVFVMVRMDAFRVLGIRWECFLPVQLLMVQLGLWVFYKIVLGVWDHKCF